MNVDEILAAFNASADDSKELLQRMLDTVAEGKVPSELDVQQLDKSVVELRDKYNRICSMAAEEVSSDEMPKEGAPAAEFAEAVRNSAAAAYREKLAEIKSVLKQFILVQSLVNNYTIALQPFQKEAESLIAELKEEGQLNEEIEEKIAGPKLFLKSVQCEDLDSDEGMDLLDQVAEYYPRRVQNGLAARKYFVSKETNDNKLENETETSEKEINIKNSTSDSSEEIDSKYDNGTDTDAARMVPDNEKAGENLTKSLDKASDRITEEKELFEPEKTEEPSEFARKVLDSGVLIEDASTVGTLTRDSSDSENKKISSSVFRNDIRKGNEKALKEIIRHVYSKNMVTLEGLTLLSNMPETIAVSSLDYLQKKGYLRKYTLTSEGDFFCASPRLMKALEYKDAAKMIGLRQRKVGVIIPRREPMRRSAFSA